MEPQFVQTLPPADPALPPRASSRLALRPLLVGLVAVVLLVGAGFLAGEQYKQRKDADTISSLQKEVGDFPQKEAQAVLEQVHRVSSLDQATITKLDANQVTVQYPNSVSRSISLKSAFGVLKVATGSTADLKVGQHITVVTLRTSKGEVAGTRILVAP